MRLVRKFKRDFGPCRHIELGDVIDTACLRSGARGTRDEAEPLDADLEIGLNWIREMGPSDWMLGNHCDRPFGLMDHPSAIVSGLAKRVVEDMRRAATDAGAKMHPYDIERGWLRVGNIHFGHGYMYNVNALRDHVEMIGGNVVMAHIHTPELFSGRVIGSPWGICVGTGMDPWKAGYARRRRQTLTWGHGFAYGEYCDGDSTKHIVSWRCEHGGKEEPRWLIS